SSMFFKLFLVLALISSVVFTGLLYSGLSNSREALVKQKSEDMTLFIERTGQYLDLYLLNIRNILLNISGRMDSDLADDPDKLRATLRDIAELNADIISHLFVLLPDGTVVSSNQLLFDII